MDDTLPQLDARFYAACTARGIPVPIGPRAEPRPTRGVECPRADQLCALGLCRYCSPGASFRVVGEAPS